MDNEKLEYLKSLNEDDLLDLYDDSICHYHYCPTTCYCFDYWKYTFGKNEVKNEILRRLLN